MAHLPTHGLRRPQCLSLLHPHCSRPSSLQTTTTTTTTSTASAGAQTRHASLLRRPHRVYTFTQLVTLSDGSTYTQRSTSPQPVVRSTKDTRNHALWQPSLHSLRNVEADEAGRLRAFRRKFGRGWDLEDAEADEADAGRDDARVGEGAVAGRDGDSVASESGSLMDLISSFAAPGDAPVAGRGKEPVVGESKAKGSKK
ncbi:MAG: hypothetical protein M1818_003560 [Claussenomyces sp. TS43310]|nr:MAG: hypothetical protein M1818_003560 [Claussenomyces sp. TS43310]